MSEPNVRLDLFDRIEQPVNKGLVALLALLALLGGVVFIVMVSGDDPERGWHIFLVNFLVFTGMALGAVIFTAAASLSNARWHGPLRRIAEGFVAFLPVSYILYWVIILLGSEHIFPWLHAHGPLIEAKRAYLNMPFLAFRGGFGLLVLYIAAWAFVKTSLRPDLAQIKDRLTGFRRSMAERITAGWQGDEAEEGSLRHKRAVLAPALVLLYVVVFTLFSFDLVMSLTPTWFSTLFGAYFFMGAFLSGLAVIALATVMLRRRYGLEDVITKSQFHDLGKLMFGFSIFWAYLFWSQFLVVWYGNLPLETQFIVVRKFPIWQNLSIAVFCCLFLIPFWGLLTRFAKMNPITHALFAGVIAFGFFIERFDLVVPALNPTPASFPFGLADLCVSLGFLSLFVLCYIGFMRTFPIVPIVGLPRKAEHASGNA
jgi:Ni/Fe-hydrogenase subunit HybB-like protein